MARFYSAANTVAPRQNPADTGPVLLLVRFSGRRIAHFQWLEKHHDVLHFGLHRRIGGQLAPYRAKVLKKK
jgi:hypothetical protein